MGVDAALAQRTRQRDAADAGADDADLEGLAHGILSFPLRPEH